MVAGIGVRPAHRSGAVVLVEASHLTPAPAVQRGWGRTGHQGTGPPPRQRQSAPLFGAVHLRTQHFYWKPTLPATHYISWESSLWPESTWSKLSPSMSLRSITPTHFFTGKILEYRACLFWP